MSNSYPAREPFYAHRYTRLLFKSCAAQSIGQDAVLLVIHIAHTEDAARYQGPVRFWNSQLNEVLGFRSPKTLNNARSKAVNSGWLSYHRKNDRADGVYWTTIPRSVLAFDDEPIEPCLSIPEPVPSTESVIERVPSTEQKAEQEGYALRNRKVTGIDPPPNPVPNPNTNTGASLSVSLEEKTTKEPKPQWEIPDGVDPDHWRDWLKVRKDKKASNTPSAWRAFCREVDKAGFSINEGVRTCAENGWKGFRAYYVAKDAKPQPRTTSDALADYEDFE